MDTVTRSLNINCPTIIFSWVLRYLQRFVISFLRVYQLVFGVLGFFSGTRQFSFFLGGVYDVFRNHVIVFFSFFWFTTFSMLVVCLSLVGVIKIRNYVAKVRKYEITSQVRKYEISVGSYWLLVSVYHSCWCRFVSVSVYLSLHCQCRYISLLWVSLSLSVCVSVVSVGQYDDNCNLAAAMLTTKIITTAAASIFTPREFSSSAVGECCLLVDGCRNFNRWVQSQER